MEYSLEDKEAQYCSLQNPLGVFIVIAVSFYYEWMPSHVFIMASGHGDAFHSVKEIYRSPVGSPTLEQ